MWQEVIVPGKFIHFVGVLSFLGLKHYEKKTALGKKKPLGLGLEHWFYI